MGEFWGICEDIAISGECSTEKLQQWSAVSRTGMARTLFQAKLVVSAQGGQHNQLREPHGLFPMYARNSVTNLANTASETALEDLNTKNMNNSAKENQEHPCSRLQSKNGFSP